MSYLYLLVDFFTILLPLIFSFHRRILFYRTWKEFFIAAALVGVGFLTWDAVFVRMEVWNFNPRYLTGIYFFSLPVEEVLFFICIPFSCVFTYYCLNSFYNLSWNRKAESIFCIVFSIALLTTGIHYQDRLYTSFTFISTAISCLFLKFFLNVSWLGKAFSVYTVLLLPFLVVNGILTGTGLEEPVVRYNPTDITGIRLLTIPIEDVFYGFELFVLNLAVWLFLKDQKRPRTLV